MKWELKYLPEAEKVFDSLSRNRQIFVDTAIKKNTLESVAPKGRWLWKTTWTQTED